VDSVKLPKEQTSKSSSNSPKGVVHPAIKRSFGRSGSMASGDSHIERTGEISLLLRKEQGVVQPALKRSSHQYLISFFHVHISVPLSQKPATTSLKIDRFVRPFTLKAVQELLGRTGSICSFWMDHINTHCYVTVCC
jgi:apoptotic chromatin condensation inducer in the nucleus